jgi:hypothetical protein
VLPGRLRLRLFTSDSQGVLKTWDLSLHLARFMARKGSGIGALRVARPGVPLLSSGWVTYPLNRPTVAVAEVRASGGRVAVCGSGEMFSDEWLPREFNTAVAEALTAIAYATARGWLDVAQLTGLVIADNSFSGALPPRGTVFVHVGVPGEAAVGSEGATRSKYASPRQVPFLPLPPQVPTSPSCISWFPMENPPTTRDA